jgi:hypothetical protein
VGIKALSGNSVDARTFVFTSDNTMRAMLMAATNNKKVVTAVTKGLGVNESTVNGIRMSHIYTVVKYDANQDRVLLRNPWKQNPAPYNGGITETGYPTGPNTGYFWLSYSDFERYFLQVAFEK